MESEKRQRRSMYERLRMLVETHLPSLHHTTLQPKAGEVVIRQNTPAEQVLIVQEGELRVEHTEPGGTPQAPLASRVQAYGRSGELLLQRTVG